MIRRGIAVACILSVLLFLLFVPFSYAAQVYYYYDNVGRLIATVTDSGQVVIYNYDEVGNLISIRTDTFSANPPVIQSINPDVLFIGSTTLVSITGQNLLTTNKVSADNPYVGIAIVDATDSNITLAITSSAQASPGLVNFTVETSYGSAATQATLTAAQLSLGPSLLSLAPGSSGSITATISPSLGRAETIQIESTDSSVVGVPQSVNIPASGTASFTVNALRNGVAYVSSGGADVAVFVSAPFTPQSGEQLTPEAAPVSVYIDSPQPTATTSSSPVSAYIDSPSGGSSLQALCSVLIESPSGGSSMQSLPVSVNIDSPQTGATMVSPPVSTAISP